MLRSLLIFPAFLLLISPVRAQDDSAGPPEPLGPEVVYFASFVPGNKLVTVGSPESELEPVCCSIFNGKLLSLWDVATGKRLDHRLFEDDLEATEASPDGKTLASWNGEECDHFTDGAIRLYGLDASDGMFGAKLGSLGGPTCMVTAAAFSPDSTHLAALYDYSAMLSGEVDETTPPRPRGEIRIWDVANFALVDSFRIQESSSQIRYSPDGQYVAVSTLVDGGVHIYIRDTRLKQSLATLVHPKDSYVFNFSPDSKLIHIYDSETAYRLPEPGQLTAPTPELAKPEATELALSDKGLTIEEGKTSITVAKAGETKAALRLRKNKPKPTKEQDDGLILNVGLLAVSDDARYVAVDSDILDLQERKLQKLDLKRPKRAGHYTVEK